MNNIVKVFFSISIFCVLAGCATQKKVLVAKDAIVEKLADGFSFTEGPAVDKEGNIFFTDQPNNQILKWSVDDKLSVFSESSGRANGLYFDRKRNLLSCSDAENEIWSFDKKANHTVLISDFRGNKLNGPNDLWVHPNGNIYFTDPLYARDYWTRAPKMQQDGENVYCVLMSEEASVIEVVTDLEKPNGIVGSPDGKHLYIADIKANKTYIYDIQKDGTLKNKKLFAPLGSDGMTIDSERNVYLTGKGVTVFNSSGTQVYHIPIDENWTSNVCFGGKNMNELFITASKGLYRLRMNVKGVR
ncbi:SMP-30/gluconolactonase/LRE family protein [Dysgonomonas sp. Marseille-P4361]|uniref:SMP-30/gluconolactonase/LRE family protein n=1 Tax=Dysgonomonas sp. Marseille-P4361 TaxID=2161820 RepID=UPI000D54FCD1|nr:SMP-30/gluconolactonase/LRE family protein [Dysgonomonas sp. Marseille-P4361]